MTPALPAEVAELRSARAIRERCRHILNSGELRHFRVDTQALDSAAQLTAEVTRSRYPALVVPPHGRLSHFDAGGVPRVDELQRALAARSPKQRARALGDVIITSVLLDAGAGAQWSYEDTSGQRIARSEGLAVASLHWLQSGALSSDGHAYEVDAEALCRVDEDALSRAFQVRPDNPLVGVPGRVHLLRALGKSLTQRRDLFPEPRPGAIVDYLATQAAGARLSAERLLGAVLEGFGGIWPGRLSLHGVALGDVWRHPAAPGSGASRGLVPFHKLSQWLCYSLLPALDAAQIEVHDLDTLTGLAEYRNGGLFLDAGVIALRDPAERERVHEVGSELIVEWRALTVALLDELAPRVRSVLGLDAARMPLAAVLEGGSWAAGRQLARKLRSDGGPPLHVASDGTVF